MRIDGPGGPIDRPRDGEGDGGDSRIDFFKGFEREWERGKAERMTAHFDAFRRRVGEGSDAQLRPAVDVTASQQALSGLRSAMESNNDDVREGTPESPADLLNARVGDKQYKVTYTTYTSHKEPKEWMLDSNGKTLDDGERIPLGKVMAEVDYRVTRRSFMGPDDTLVHDSYRMLEASDGMLVGLKYERDRPPKSHKASIYAIGEKEALSLHGLLRGRVA